MNKAPSRLAITELMEDLEKNPAMKQRLDAEVLWKTIRKRVARWLGGSGKYDEVIEKVNHWFQDGAKIEKRAIYTPRTWWVKKMKIQDTVERHQKRMLRLFTWIKDTFKSLDIEKLAFQIRFHDVEEMTQWWIGDIPTPAKEKMSWKNKGTLDTITKQILSLHAPECARISKYTGDSVGALLEVSDKTTPETKILKWLDYIDAYMVTLREISIHENNSWESDIQDLQLLRRRKKRYQERMWEFIRINSSIFNLSDTDYFDPNLWQEHFNSQWGEWFKLYEKWNRTTKGM